MPINLGACWSTYADMNLFVMVSHSPCSVYVMQSALKQFSENFPSFTSAMFYIALLYIAKTANGNGENWPHIYFFSKFIWHRSFTESNFGPKENRSLQK